MSKMKNKTPSKKQVPTLRKPLYGISDNLYSLKDEVQKINDPALLEMILKLQKEFEKVRSNVSQKYNWD